MTTITLIYTTFSKKSDAQRILKALMQKRLVACGVLSAPVQSTYFWKGKVPSEREYLLTLKTANTKAKAAKQLLGKLHPYEVPCILSWRVDANKPYAHWVNRETE